MKELLFVIHPLWWIGGIHISSLWIGLAGGVLIGLFLFVYHRFRTIRRVSPHPGLTTHHATLIDPHHIDYAELTLIEIRRYLAALYPPEHSWAHIPERLARYTRDMRLLEIVEQLERAEYSKNKLTLGEQEDINRELGTKIKI